MMTRSLSLVVIHASPTVCQVLANVLQDQGHQVHCFLDPVAVLHALLQTKTVPQPDLLFLNITSTSQLTAYEGRPLGGHCVPGAAHRKDANARALLGSTSSLRVRVMTSTERSCPGRWFGCGYP